MLHYNQCREQAHREVEEIFRTILPERGLAVGGHSDKKACFREIFPECGFSGGFYLQHCPPAGGHGGIPALFIQRFVGKRHYTKSFKRHYPERERAFCLRPEAGIAVGGGQRQEEK